MSKGERIELGNGMILEIHECPQDDVGIMPSSEEVWAGPIAVDRDYSFLNFLNTNTSCWDEVKKEEKEKMKSAVQGDNIFEVQGSYKEKEEVKSIAIKHVIFDGPATIVFWDDGTKTVVKCTDDDSYSYDVGIAMATLKKIFGENYSTYKHAVSDAISDAIDRELKKKDRKKTLATRDILGLEKIVEGLKKAYGIKHE